MRQSLRGPLFLSQKIGKNAVFLNFPLEEIDGNRYSSQRSPVAQDQVMECVTCELYEIFCGGGHAATAVAMILGNSRVLGREEFRRFLPAPRGAIYQVV